MRERERRWGSETGKGKKENNSNREEDDKGHEEEERWSGLETRDS